MAIVYRLTIREFAEIFGISKAHAEAILKEKKAPSLELAFRISRYFGVKVDELFGWRFDDDGNRHSLVAEINGELVTIPESDHTFMAVFQDREPREMDFCGTCRGTGLVKKVDGGDEVLS
jgi:DNA-binding XRE family transcriptional regulator